MKLAAQLLLPISVLSMSACSMENKTDSGDLPGTDTAEDFDTADTGESHVSIEDACGVPLPSPLKYL